MPLFCSGLIRLNSHMFTWLPCHWVLVLATYLEIKAGIVHFECPDPFLFIYLF